MKQTKLLPGLHRWLGVAVLLSAMTVLSSAQTQETVLHAFTFHEDGAMPYAGLTFDANGNLYGTTYFAGLPNEGICCGTVYQLTPNGSGGWDFHVIYIFNVEIGEAPSGSVVLDQAGNVYGTTQGGGFCGTAFKLTPQQGLWKATVLHYFNNLDQRMIDDGCLPSSYMVFDQHGNLYGTTQQTGASDCMTSAGCGTVFELSPGEDGHWTETILHRFPANSVTDGSNPYGGLVFDKEGNLWGTTLAGGSAGLGTVFELTPSANATYWTERVAFNFTGNFTGYEPYAGLVIDAAGNLYGTTYFGGSEGVGLVFEMTPDSNGQVNETMVHSFEACNLSECPDGVAPFGGLVFDSAGDLFGTTVEGGAAGDVCISETGQRVGCGVLYKLTPQSNGNWQYSIVHRFPGDAAGGYPTDDHLAVDANGNIFGTTFVEGDVNDPMCPDAVLGLGGCGVVFEITP